MAARGIMDWSRPLSERVLDQNPEIAEAFRLTYPRPIEHNTGRPEDPGTALPGSKFAEILEDSAGIDSRREVTSKISRW